MECGSINGSWILYRKYNFFRLSPFPSFVSFISSYHACTPRRQSVKIPSRSLGTKSLIFRMSGRLLNTVKLGIPRTFVSVVSLPLIKDLRCDDGPARYRTTFTTSSKRNGEPEMTGGNMRSKRDRMVSRNDLPAILSGASMVQLCRRPENMDARLVGLDVAPTKFGVAVSDETRRLAIPVTVIHRRDPKSKKALDQSGSGSVFAKLRRVIEESSACGLVVGWPLALSGEADGQCLMVLRFLREMRLVGKVMLPVTFRDERMTTVGARCLLYEEGLGYEEVSACEDEAAAMIILQGFLDSPEAEAGGLSTWPTPPFGPGSR